MSNRRKLKTGRKAARSTKGQALTSTPSASTVYRWVKEAEAEGGIQRAADERTGKPGRPAHVWELTEEGRERAKRLPPARIMMEQVRRRENARKRRSGGGS